MESTLAHKPGEETLATGKSVDDEKVDLLKEIDEHGSVFVQIRSVLL